MEKGDGPSGRLNLPERLDRPQPDIAVIKLHPITELVLVDPSEIYFLIEVADSSLRYDSGPKLARYAAAGIPEVWIPNVAARHVEAFHDPVDGAYQSSRIVPTDGRISPRAFPDVVLTVGDFLLG